jgi:thiamine pyrophosphokinase
VICLLFVVGDFSSKESLRRSLRLVTEAVARKRLHVKDFKYPYKDSKALAPIASIPTSNLTSICVVGSARSDHTIAQLQKLLVASKNLESLTIVWMTNMFFDQFSADSQLLKGLGK